MNIINTKNMINEVFLYIFDNSISLILIGFVPVPFNLTNEINTAIANSMAEKTGITLLVEYLFINIPAIILLPAKPRHPHNFRCPTDFSSFLPFNECKLHVSSNVPWDEEKNV